MISIYENQRRDLQAYEPSSKHIRHVIVVGNPGANQLKDFIREFYHDDHTELSEDPLPDLVVLIETASEIRVQLADFLESCATYRDQVILLLGSPLHRVDVLRVNMVRSTAIFIVLNKYTCDHMKEDAANILRLCAQRRFVVDASYSSENDRSSAKSVSIGWQDLAPRQHQPETILVDAAKEAQHRVERRIPRSVSDLVNQFAAATTPKLPPRAI